MAIISSKQPDEPSKGGQTQSSKPKSSKPQSVPTKSAESQTIEATQPKNKLLEGQARADELSRNDDGIRPQSLADYIGQKALKEVLGIAIAATKSRKEPLDHLLLYGPPGLGKTTMALILAQEMQVDCKITTAPALERPRDIAGLLVNLKAGDILFIAEIHRLSRVTEEILYPAMEDSRLDQSLATPSRSLSDQTQ